ncbi:MAG TPA: NAD(P)-dependent oxidoreductase [Ideonella sp.]|nr:NAD(P)-dependent oxidoreductase [Ideonella sp.]
MRVAVSGATGFVGRHVVAELERCGIETVLLLRAPAPALVPQQRTARGILRVDVEESGADVFEAAGRPDVLIHLAWGGLPNYRSLHHFEQQTVAHYRWLKNLLNAGLTRLLVAGTCFEYGMLSGPLNEAMRTRPATPYGFAKDMLRRQLEWLAAERPFSLTWARLFYMHGDGQSSGSLLPQLRAAVERGDEVFPMSGGEQLRDYLPVSEVARLLVLLAGGSGHGVVNVSSGRPISVRRLVEDWILKHGWSIRPDYGRYPYPDHEPMAFWGDRTKLDRCLGAINSSPSGNPFQRP